MLEFSHFVEMNCCECRLNCAVLLLLLSLIALKFGDGETISQGDALTNQQGSENSNDPVTYEIQMPGITPTKDDEYICQGWKVPDGEYFVVKFQALATSDTAHHLLLFGCPEPVSESPVHDCHGPCFDSKVMYAWARNAAPLELPEDVGFHIGNNTDVKYLSMQVHYATMFADADRKDYTGVQLTVTKTRQKYVAGILLLVSGSAVIPPKTKNFHVDVSCYFDGDDVLYPFAFRTHTHMHGRVVSAYMFNGTWFQLGKGNPHWPQAFWPIKENYAIRHLDGLASRCTYDSSDSDKEIPMGETHNDEMCNFYLMYYTDSHSGRSYYSCVDNAVAELAMKLPSDSDVPLPPDPYLDEIGEGVTSKGSKTVNRWTRRLGSGQLPLGQVCAVAVDANGSVFVFHRGRSVWDASSFDSRANFRLRANGPIREKTMIQINASTFDVVAQWADDTFYLPHGLSVDASGNFWVTDVALHQVMRFGPLWSSSQAASKPELVLGVAFEPGDDERHFCKPADVAVLRSGEFFVADGYCNSRVMKFSKDGIFIKQWGQHSQRVELTNSYPPPSTFDLVHSIVVLENRDLVCVADRENARVQCFTYDGNFVSQLHLKEFKPQIFAITYNEQTGYLYTISGPSESQQENVTLKGNTIDMRNGTLLNSWHPVTGFSQPHDVAVSPDGCFVYVVEIGPNVIWKFKLQTAASHQSVKKAGAFVHPISVGNDDGNTHVEEEEAEEEEGLEKKESYVGATLIIGGLIIMPLIVMVLILVFLRCRRKAKAQPSASRSNNRRFNLGSLLAGSRASEFIGKDDERRLELKHLQSDSEVEEYSSVPQQNNA